MSVKHVCPNCGSTLTLDAPMPSLRCPKCKTTMQPEIATPLQLGVFLAELGGDLREGLGRRDADGNGTIA